MSICGPSLVLHVLERGNYRSSKNDKIYVIQFGDINRDTRNTAE